MHYLSYDIKGIQHFIFSVPRLKCMIGASSQIARFDEETVDRIANKMGASLVFSGGGRGVLACQSEASARDLERELVKAARVVGLDVQTGLDHDFSRAIRQANRLFTFCPPAAELHGFPCQVSGLWPVGNSQSRMHPLIAARIRESRKDFLEASILDEIEHSLPDALYDNGRKVEFLRNVNPEVLVDEDSLAVDQARAHAGQWSLGARNRWAIIALDGNDMGRQFEALEKSFHGSELADKLKIVSDSLRQTTHAAFNQALIAAITNWTSSTADLEACTYSAEDSRHLVLPFRPLIRGGDDIVLIAHGQLAMSFVQTMAKTFSLRSIDEGNRIQREHGFNPWHPTGGRLTISAGILYAKCSLPLHTAIPYAESLLASAKGRFRSQGRLERPTPSAVDWDAVTDSMIDTPAARRQRELVFIDQEIDSAIYLTRRPFLLDDAESEHGRLPSLERLLNGLLAVPTRERSSKESRRIRRRGGARGSRRPGYSRR